MIKFFQLEGQKEGTWFPVKQYDATGMVGFRARTRILDILSGNRNIVPSGVNLRVRKTEELIESFRLNAALRVLCHE